MCSRCGSVLARPNGVRLEVGVDLSAQPTTRQPLNQITNIAGLMRLQQRSQCWTVPGRNSVAEVLSRPELQRLVALVVASHTRRTDTEREVFVLDQPIQCAGKVFAWCSHHSTP